MWDFPKVFAPYGNNEIPNNKEMGSTWIIFLGSINLEEWLLHINQEWIVWTLKAGLVVPKITTSLILWETLTDFHASIFQF